MMFEASPKSCLFFIFCIFSECSCSQAIRTKYVYICEIGTCVYVYFSELSQVLD